MKNNKYLILIAVVCTLSFVFCAWYYSNNKHIYVTETQADEINVVASTVETCSRLGFIHKDSDNDLKHIVSRLRFKDKNNVEQKLDMNLFEQKVNMVTDSFINDEEMDISNPYSIGFNILKGVCDSKNSIAINIKKQYN